MIDSFFVFFAKKSQHQHGNKNNCTCNLAVSKLHSKDDCIKFITFHERVLEVNFL